APSAGRVLARAPARAPAEGRPKTGRRQAEGRPKTGGAFISAMRAPCATSDAHVPVQARPRMSPRTGKASTLGSARAHVLVVPTRWPAELSCGPRGERASLCSDCLVVAGDSGELSLGAHDRVARRGATCRGNISLAGAK